MFSYGIKNTLDCKRGHGNHNESRVCQSLGKRRRCHIYKSGEQCL